MNTSKARKSIAQALRRLAHRLSPDHITSLDVTWERDKPPHVDLQLRGQSRISGYVVSDADELGLNKGLPGIDRLIQFASERATKAATATLEVTEAEARLIKARSAKGKK